MTAAPTSSPPTATADLSTGRIVATVEIAAPPARVFRALTTRELLDWWGSPDAYRTTRWEADLRVGGLWRSDGVGADGTRFSVHGEFLALDAPHRVAFTWLADWDGGAPTTVTYELEAIARGTRLTVRHEGFQGRTASCEDHTAGWTRVLGWLREFVEPAAAAQGAASA